METMIITCIQCDEEFEFTVEEQEKFQRRGFDAPLRCSQCRKNKYRDVEHQEKRKFRDKKKRHRPKSVDLFDY